MSHPSPPPRVSPAIPVVEMNPPVVGQTKGLGLPVELSPGETAFGSGESHSRIHQHSLHWGEIDDESVIAGGLPGDVVPAAANGDEKVLSAREVQGANHIG
jgi:hypothetical protein